MAAMMMGLMIGIGSHKGNIKPRSVFHFNIIIISITFLDLDRWLDCTLHINGI